MKYVKRYNKFSLQTNCRICLTQSISTKVALNAPLQVEQNPNLLVYEALELITKEKVPITAKYPDSVCGMCSQFLRISYDLIAQYHDSKKKIKEQLRELGEDVDTECKVSYAKFEPEIPKAPVEIVVGREKFNIQDVFIVEEENDDTVPFEGFLKNLGKSVTASFVEKGYKKPKLNVEAPALVIEKIVREPLSPESSEEVVVEMGLDDIDPDSPNLPVQELSNDESQYIDEPVNIELFSNMEMLNDKDKDVMESALNLKYKCPHCSKPMSSLTRAKIHSRRCEISQVNAKCYVCGKTFESLKNVLRHMKIEHLHKDDTTATKKCYVCGETFQSRKLLLTHIKLVHLHQEGSDSKYVCRICGKSLTSNGSLSYHMSKHSGKRHGCDKCDKRFYTKTQVQSHAQTHNREKTVVMCPICGKGFHYQSGLFYHMKMHTNERNLPCSYCPRRFYTRNSVKRHELTHTGGRPYSCQFCEKKFRSLGEVRKHEFLHTGERPFQCKYCDTGFTQAHNLKMHLMTHSGNHQCLHCCKSFADVETLRFHLKNKHQIHPDPTASPVDVPNTSTVVPNQNDTESPEEVIEDEMLAETSEIQLENQDEFYITEEFEEQDISQELLHGDDDDDDDETNRLIVKTYELRDEVLVETIENLN